MAVYLMAGACAYILGGLMLSMYADLKDDEDHIIMMVLWPYILMMSFRSVWNSEKEKNHEKE